MVTDANLLIADPGGHPPQEAVLFAHAAHDVDDLSIQEAEVAGVERDIDVGNPVDHPVKKRSGSLLEPGFAVPFAANGVDDFVPFPPFRDQLQNRFRRILKIKGFNYVNEKAIKGVSIAHSKEGIPVINIKMDRLNEYFLGKLIYFFEVSCAVSGFILGVNPFNQPGVEKYKKQILELLAEK